MVMIQCLPLTKECRMAALAYAPCLPAVERESPPIGCQGSSRGPGSGRSRSSDSRRPSALEVARMHRRASYRKSSGHFSHKKNVEMPQS